jgi:signal transduction histidine kinase
MHERVNYVHGSLTVRSGLRAGTEIIARVPVAGGPADELS